jgi:predicted nuclease of predicted toxin-antitoxin system
MLFKIDENLHEEVAELLRQNGHDAVSVYDQHMRGHTDEDVAAVCRREGRVIVTQDRDFSNIVAFPPEDYAGIIVFRPHDPSRPSILAAMHRLVPLLASQSLSGCLWTVDDVGMRIRPGGQP